MSNTQPIDAQNTHKAQTSQTKAQKNAQKKKQRQIKSAQNAERNVVSIESLNFSFYPNTVEPEFGISRNIFNSDYYFTVDKKSLNINLPYLGRFYATPVAHEEVPINLTSSQFLYFVHTDDEVTFEVTIIPSDQQNLLNQGIKFFFTINKQTQETTLKVTADNRQDITYQGTFQ